ncbi:co-chaperone DjlA [Marinobacter halodurans]|uniref:Co-chaperone protein DjlA n=1 Tax=Marinobacter halodurans TaxID=2528979 RepID=A0ABY1ZN92_9GAMM|nr:co-chaperone DjlA [Marinobacter halodurans]TBW57959.1 co-chaperone DjlA [Marinobacter halodurans]
MFLAIFFGALIGYQIGRLPGLIVGAVAGYFISNALRNKLRSGIFNIQSQFLESTFAVMGALCKADGVVTEDEIQVAETLFNRLHLSGEQRESAKVAFRRGKEADFDLDAELEQLLRVTRGNQALLQMFLQVQVSAVAADGAIHPAEHEMLLRIARKLGLPESQIDQLEAMMRGAYSGAGSSAGAGPSSGRKLADAYKVLGVSEDASDAEVKRAYRKLMSENHPDKLAGRGLPESMREMAEEKTREISNAYDVIKAARAA